MNTDARDRLQAFRSRLRQARRVQQILARRRDKARRLSLAPVSLLSGEAGGRDLSDLGPHRALDHQSG